MDDMAMLEREFYRNARGSKPTDQDAWQLVFDDKLKRLFVRHELQSAGQTGVREYTIDDFVAGHGVAADALVALLFNRAQTRSHVSVREA
jgi:hypothetical protein